MEKDNNISSNSNESDHGKTTYGFGAQLQAFLERREIPDGPIDADVMEELRREQQNWDAKFSDLTVHGKAICNTPREPAGVCGSDRKWEQRNDSSGDNRQRSKTWKDEAKNEENDTEKMRNFE